MQLSRSGHATNCCLEGTKPSSHSRQPTWAHPVFTSTSRHTDCVQEGLELAGRSTCMSWRPNYAAANRRALKLRLRFKMQHGGCSTKTANSAHCCMSGVSPTLSLLWPWAVPVMDPLSILRQHPLLVPCLTDESHAPFHQFHRVPALRIARTRHSWGYLSHPLFLDSPYQFLALPHPTATICPVPTRVLLVSTLQLAFMADHSTGLQ